MKLSEKTIELNICAQLSRLLPEGMFWFGLTQKQERRAGFDACTRLGSRLVVIQFKASREVLRSGRRRFRLDHEQLMNLKSVAAHDDRTVFYAFPRIGTTAEMPKPPDLLPLTPFIDVRTIDVIDPPTKRDGGLRKSGLHYADASAIGLWDVTIHSEPVLAKGIPGRTLPRLISDGPGLNLERVSSYAERVGFSRSAYALALPGS